MGKDLRIFTSSGRSERKRLGFLPLVQGLRYRSNAILSAVLSPPSGAKQIRPTRSHGYHRGLLLHAAPQLYSNNSPFQKSGVCSLKNCASPADGTETTFWPLVRMGAGRLFVLQVTDGVRTGANATV